MNDKQLAILLNKYQKMLESAIESVKESLPQEMIVYSKNLLGQQVSTYPCLDDLYSMDATMQDDIELLKDQV